MPSSDGVLRLLRAIWTPLVLAAILTAAQNDYIFKAVSIPAPLGTWQREQAGGMAYLHAERVVERLRDKPREFALDRLIAITNLPLRDDETSELYAWDEDPKGQISLFSTYGLLDRIRPPLTIERMVANAVAAFVGGLTEHKTGKKDCPFYYNEERDVFPNSVYDNMRICRSDSAQTDGGDRTFSISAGFQCREVPAPLEEVRVRRLAPVRCSWLSGWPWRAVWLGVRESTYVCCW